MFPFKDHLLSIQSLASVESSAWSGQVKLYCALVKPYASIMESRVTADAGDGTKDSRAESIAVVRKGDMMAYDRWTLWAVEL